MKPYMFMGGILLACLFAAPGAFEPASSAAQPGDANVVRRPLRAAKTTISVPDRINPYEICVVEVETEAKGIEVEVGKDFFDVVEVYQLQGPSRYAWTGPPGKYLVSVRTVDETYIIKTHKVVVMVGDVPTTPTDPTPPPLPPGSTLEAATRKALAAVPDHPKKKATAIALASVFEEVGNQYDAGNITTEELFPTLETAINTVINALDTAPHWGTFQLSIKAAINAEKLTPAELPAAFGQIAQGLTNDEESIIDIAPSVIALIQAIIAKDQGAIIQAVLQIVLALVGGL